MRIQFGADVLHHFIHGTAGDLALLDFAGTAVNDLVPLRFGVGILLRIEAGDELMGQIRPVGRGEGQHFGNFFSRKTHTLGVSTICGGSTSGVVAAWLRETGRARKAVEDQRTPGRWREEFKSRR